MTIHVGEIRGLTLWRPWAAAFLQRASRVYWTDGTETTIRPKRVENRDWYPKWAVRPMVGGVAEARPDSPLHIALHAGCTLDREALASLRADGWAELGPGAPSLIVGICRLVRVLDYDELGMMHPLVQPHAAWAVGRYLWEVDDVQPLAEAVDCKGAQGLWKLPAGIEEQVRSQIGRMS